MPLLFRYVFARFLGIFLLVLCSLSFIVVLFDVIELLREAAKIDIRISFGSLLLMGIFKLPQVIYLLLPFVVLISVIIFLVQFTKTSELIVMRSVGLSVWRFSFPLVMAVLMIGIFQVCLLSPVSSWVARRYERMEEQWGFTSSSPFSFTEEGLWLREPTADGTIVVRSGRVRQENGQIFLDDTTVLKLDTDDTLVQFAHAKGSLLQSDQLILQNAFVFNPQTEKESHAGQLAFTTHFTLKQILEKFDEPDTMSFWRFPSFIRFLESSGFSSLLHRMYWHNLIVFPFFLVTMLFVGLTFALMKTLRQGKVFGRLILALLGGFLFYFLGRIANILGLSESLPVILAAWVPVLIALPLCISALLHFEDG